MKTELYIIGAWAGFFLRGLLIWPTSYQPKTFTRMVIIWSSIGFKTEQLSLYIDVSLQAGRPINRGSIPGISRQHTDQLMEHPAPCLVGTWGFWEAHTCVSQLFLWTALTKFLFEDAQVFMWRRDWIFTFTPVRGFWNKLLGILTWHNQLIKWKEDRPTNKNGKLLMLDARYQLYWQLQSSGFESFAYDKIKHRTMKHGGSDHLSWLRH